jgi:hypothetical protein
MPEESRLDAKRRQQAEARAALAQELDDDDGDGGPAHLAKIEIDHCHRCDDEGYRGAVVCDHREHSTPAGRAAAMAMFRDSQKGA